MKKLIFSVIFMAMLCGCTSNTGYGYCVGVFDEKDNLKIYKLSAMNLVIAIVFFELIVPPVIVAADETFCPVGLK